MDSMVRTESNFWSRYNKIEKIGEGAFGKVYLVQHKKSKRYFALKLIPSKAKGKEREYLIYEYIQEIEWNRDSDVEHPGRDRILRIHDRFMLDNGKNLFTAVSMKYVRGKPLNKYKRLPMKEAVVMAEQLFLGLDYLHSLDIAHCDIKLSNIIWDDNTKLLTILDLANSLVYKPTGKYQIYDYRGGLGLTRMYACPDVLRAYVGKLKPIHFELFIQGDIWAACLTIIMLMTKCPFPGYWYKDIESEDPADWYEYLLPYIENYTSKCNELGQIMALGLRRTGNRPKARDIYKLIRKIK